MKEHILNEEYVKILCNETFLKTIILRTASPENNINLLRAYEIPIPEVNSEYWSPVEVMNIVNRLKDIAKYIDFNGAILYGNTSDAVSFMDLLEVISGKKRFNELAYLVFNEMYI